MAKAFTTAAVERYRPTGRRRVIRDGGARSLYLVVEPSGHKSWLMRFRRPDGKPGKMILGPLDLSGREISGEPEVGQPLSLVAARQLAARVHRDRARGIDVVADHKARKHRQRSAAADRATGNFAAAARAFVEGHAKPKTRRWRETARMLGLNPDNFEPASGGLAERWADRDARSIDGHDVHQVVEEAHRVGIPGIAARNGGPSEPRARAIAAALSSCFGWFQRRRLVDANPCAGVHRPAAPRPRDRVLTSAEIVKFWRATAAGTPFDHVLRLLLLTGCRLNEIAGLRWDEISEDDSSALHLPGSRTKNGRLHVVPLAPLAREILAGVPRIDNCPFVFSTNGRSPVSGWSKVKARLDAVMNIPPWRLHDLRRTAVTGMAELGIAPHVIELVVNHVSGVRAGVAGTYNRSELLPERRAALERWSQHVLGLVQGRPANVTPIAARRA
jgi:integrase